MLQFIPVAMGQSGEGMPRMWAHQQMPAGDGLSLNQSGMEQQPQFMQMMLMPMPMGQWDQAQPSVYGAAGAEGQPLPTMMQTRPNNNSTRGYPKRPVSGPAPDTKAHLRQTVEGGMLPEELAVMRRALAEMQQVRATKTSSMDSLPSYQGSTLDSLPSIDADLDSPSPSAGVGQPEAAALMKSLTGSDEQVRAESLEHVANSMWPMAVQRHGCRVAQKAFEVADQDQRELLAEGLRGRIREALESPHGNYVIQKCVETSAKGAEIVLDEMCGAFLFFSRRRFGCRVIERLLENCSSPQVFELAREVMREADMLIQHPYGNFVMQHMLKYGASEDRHQIVQLLLRDIYILSKHRVASHVIEAALAHCGVEDRNLLIQSLSADQAELALLAQSHYGSFVVREMMRVQAGTTPGDHVPRMF